MNVKWGYIVATYTIACAKCRQAHETMLTGAMTVSAAAADARNAGWSHVRGLGWVCEECAGETSKLEICQCLRCSHSWASRRKNRETSLPVRCPGCGSPYWNRPRKGDGDDPGPAPEPGSRVTDRPTRRRAEKRRIQDPAPVAPVVGTEDDDFLGIEADPGSRPGNSDEPAHSEVPDGRTYIADEYAQPDAGGDFNQQPRRGRRPR